jgi:hypothetical protein
MPFSSPGEYYISVIITILLESVTHLPEDNYYNPRAYWDRTNSYGFADQIGGAV